MWSNPDRNRDAARPKKTADSSAGRLSAPACAIATPPDYFTRGVGAGADRSLQADHRDERRRRLARADRSPERHYHDLFPPGPCAQDTVCAPPASFDATLTLYFADGSVYIQRTVTLSQDKGASLGFSPTTFGADGRVALRGEVVVSPDAELNQVFPTLANFSVRDLGFMF